MLPYSDGNQSIIFLNNLALPHLPIAIVLTHHFGFGCYAH